MCLNPSISLRSQRQGRPNGPAGGSSQNLHPARPATALEAAPRPAGHTRGAPSSHTRCRPSAARLPSVWKWGGRSTMQPSSAAVAGASRRCPRKSFTFPSAEHESELEELAWWAAGCDAAASQAHLPAQRSCSDSCCDASSMAARAHSFSSSHSRSRSGRMSSSSFTSGCLSSGSSFTSQGDLWALRHASDTLLREASSASAFSVASSVTGHVMPAAATPSGELLMLPAAGVDAAWAGPAGPSPDVSEAIAAIEAEMAAVAQLRKLQAQRRAAIARVLAGTAASGAPALAAPAPSFPATMHGVTAAAEQLQHLLQALSM